VRVGSSLDQIVDRDSLLDDGAGAPRLLVPGRNCWRIEPAPRAAVLVDAAEFFARFEQALSRAQRSILIAGWDFDGRIRLRPDCDDSPSLGDVLRSLVESRPDLHVNILVWSIATIHAPSAPAELLIGSPWQDHPRISLRLDAEHPFYASHHQKIVCIDDAIAFVGGIDLTVDRWDTCAHREDDRHRVLPDGSPYSPVHDVQMVVTGAAARALGTLVRERWRRATGEVLPPAGSVEDDEHWPDDLKPDFEAARVGIARTEPAWRGNPAVEEIAALTADMLEGARQSIYIEAQYFAARGVRRVLEKSLAARRGPEIVVLVTRITHSTIERIFMGDNRDRLVRRLRRADRHNRLRVFYPVVAGASGPCDVLIHAKVMIVDDRLLRIGSANLNNRSMGLDTECDAIVEALGPAQRHAVAAVRARLLGEHLGVPPDVVAQTLAREGSLIRTIDKLNRGERGLRPFPEVKVDGPTRSRLGTALFDPRRPFEPLWWRRRHPPARRSAVAEAR